MAAPSSEPIANVGDVIGGKFRVERVLGEGGMGLVLEATHLMLEERVALKFLRPQVLIHKDVVARFAQEARAAAKLKSEHIARVLDVGEDRSVPYIVMELLEGQNLEQLLAERGPLPVSDAVELLIQAAEGISEAHARGIIHRDLKPANLFLTERSGAWSTLKIVDFGISKAALSKSDVPSGPGKTMSLLGSPHYMSPEQLRSTRDVDRRTDLWSLGVVLYELLAGRTPFVATEFIALVNDILDEPHPPLLGLRPDVPEALAAIVDRALAKDPAERIQSAGELALALLPFTTSKRARVIASHAVTLTRSAGIDPELPLPSHPPPAMSSGATPVRPEAWASGRAAAAAAPSAGRAEGATAAVSDAAGVAPSAVSDGSGAASGAASGSWSSGPKSDPAISPFSVTSKVERGGATQPSFEIPSARVHETAEEPKAAASAPASPSGSKQSSMVALYAVAALLAVGGGLFVATRESASAPGAPGRTNAEPPQASSGLAPARAAASAAPSVGAGATAGAGAAASADAGTGTGTGAVPSTGTGTGTVPSAGTPSADATSADPSASASGPKGAAAAPTATNARRPAGAGAAAAAGAPPTSSRGGDLEIRLER